METSLTALFEKASPRDSTVYRDFWNLFFVMERGSFAGNGFQALSYRCQYLPTDVRGSGEGRCAGDRVHIQQGGGGTGVYRGKLSLERYHLDLRGYDHEGSEGGGESEDRGFCNWYA